MVITPHRSTSRINGTSLNPCTTASLCINTAIFVPADSWDRLTQKLWQVKASVLPIARQILTAFLNRSVFPDQAGTADADERGELQSLLALRA